MLPTYPRGRCSNDVCGRDLACKPYTRDKARALHKCVCPHDESLPDKDMRCRQSNRVVVTDHEPGTPIHLNLPGSHLHALGLTPTLTPAPALGLGPGPGPGPGPSPYPAFQPAPRPPPPSMTTRDPSVGPVKAKGMATHWGVGVGVFAAAVLVAVAVLWYSQRRSGRGLKSQTPRSLSKGPLGSDMFLPNPQYALGVTGLGLGGLGGDALRGQGGGGRCVSLIGHRALELQESIGEGCFGKVYRGELRASDGVAQTVAVKVLKESASSEAEQDFMREVEVMSAFQHPHILQLIGEKLDDDDLDLPRPPGFLPVDLPPLSSLSLSVWYGAAVPDGALGDLDGEVGVDGVLGCGPGPEDQLLDPDNYLLPRAPDPNRVPYLEPIAD
ncbi:Tyrosine-protein kinase transmembrane receptor Ror [Frankliniella fusca]|uniref:Tyrosine-protein kinase transmembrane receptor Ror n=1 Tax=Frankliniella fusca TaxID=407009 RepID=A0AAE1GSN7_9NEOP|nr:Tyrosine-protein kinase transmembrane receptor Ror [Frankliniella fusca]